jgi:hypothetical protein
MTSQVLSQAINKLDAALVAQNSALSERVGTILNDIAHIERQLWKKGDSVQHLMALQDLIAKARTLVGG